MSGGAKYWATYKKRPGLESMNCTSVPRRVEVDGLAVSTLLCEEKDLSHRLQVQESQFQLVMFKSCLWSVSAIKMFVGVQSSLSEMFPCGHLSMYLYLSLPHCLWTNTD